MSLPIKGLKSYILLIVLLLTLLHASNPLPAEAQDPDEAIDPVVEAIFNSLTPQERVGQLFVVSFTGTNVGPESGIAELIQFYRIGGIMISAKNRNFINRQDTPWQVLALTNALQILAQKAPTVPVDNPQITTTLTPTTTITESLSATVPEIYNPLPLFIAVTHEGDGYPDTQIRTGLTDIPNQMALGATWETSYAHQVGQVVGRELSLLGVNMLFGPSLDVLDSPRLDRGNSLGTRTFGGHPNWVGEMGHAYIQGIHEGSEGELLTIAKHFPGFGSSDREINQGVPTIFKSLDELRRVDLLPFFRVTQLDTDNPLGITDGLLTTHVRYQGLQGTVPISLDARNLPAILALKEIAPWRNAGGLIVSAPLGVPAALEGITGNRDNFPARRLAQDAFLAGNDVLLLLDFAFDNDAESQFANIKNAIGFFQEKYQTDPNFQRAVDRSVRRVLKAKVKIYGEDLLQTPAQQAVENLNGLGSIPIDLDRIAQAGVTLITPDTQEGLTRLTDPPQPGENVLIFTDDRLARDCLTCPDFRLISTTALEEIILQLFGPNATGQISSEQLSSFSFETLKELLSGNRTETGEAIELAIREADWIIFTMLDIAPEAYPSSDAVRILLRNRFDALRNKKLVLFAFNAPYFLDETEISQLTAYYGFYSKTQDYLKAAARLLFQQFKPSGASPVGIPAIGPLNLSPDPNQIIELEPVHKIAKDGTMIPLEEISEVASIDLEVGEGILFKTSVIMDRNGHPVPDGTLVDFFRFYPLEGLSLEPLQSRTNRGVAEIVIVKERDTPLQVRASSNLAVQSETYNIGPGIVDTPTPTPTWTATPTSTPTPTATPSVTATPVIVTATPTIDLVPTTTPVPLEPLPPAKPVNLLDLIYSLFGAILIGGIAFTLGGERFPLEERVRSALVAVAVGLVGYIFFTIATMAFPHNGYMEHILSQSANGHWVAPLVTLLFAIMGVLIWHLKPGRVFWKEIK